MKLIVAVDKNWAIGHENKLLFSIPADMKFFRETTTGNVVVMGRKTLESFPGGRPLKKRVNVVISRQADYQVEGAQIVHSVEEAVKYLAQYDSDTVYVIGGDSIYKQMLPYCDVAHVTYMDSAFEADTWFPNLDRDPEWVLDHESEVMCHEEVNYSFRTYVRKQA